MTSNDLRVVQPQNRVVHSKKTMWLEVRATKGKRIHRRISVETHFILWGLAAIRQITISALLRDLARLAMEDHRQQQVVDVFVSALRRGKSH